MLFDKTMNKVNVFYNWNLGDVTGQLWEEKTLLKDFLLVLGTYDTLDFSVIKLLVMHL